MSTQPSPPHFHRLFTQVRHWEGPRLELWGWPGTGKRSWLNALEQAEPRRAVRLEVPGATAAARGGARWLLWTGAIEDLPADVEPASGQTLVYAASATAAEAPASTLRLPPESFLLDEAEVGELATGHATGPVSPDLVRRLHHATDGWLKPVLLALAAGVLSRRPEPTPAALVGVPAIAAFLRREVLDPLPVAVVRLLLELAGQERIDPEVYRELWVGDQARTAALDELVGRLGFALAAEGGGLQLPRLLAALLEGERERYWSAGETFTRRAHLALAAIGLGHPDLALQALAQAGDAPRASHLLEQSWLDLLGSASLPTLQAALSLVRRQASYGGELLGLVADAVAGERRRAAAGLADLAARSHAPPAITATARLVLAVVRGARAAPEVAAAARREWAGLGPLSPALERLARLAEGEEAPEALPAGSDGEAAADRLVVVGLRGSSTARPQLVRRPLPEALMAGPPKPTFEVFLLGPPRVVVNLPAERREVRWGLRRAFRIFAYLASTAGQQASRDELIEVGFPTETEATIERNFHPTLSHLRRSFHQAWAEGAEPLIFRQGVYRLNPAIDWRIDTVDFESLARRAGQRAEAGELRAAIELWQAAWRLYGGPFLDGEYAAWAESRREALSEVYMQILGRLGDALVDATELGLAMDAYRSLLLVNPLEERVHLAVMRILARQGRRDLLRRQYDRLCSQLREELGVEPLQETTAEYHRLMG